MTAAAVMTMTRINYKKGTFKVPFSVYGEI